jgi:Skp family chaperone for outer membrane proteins
MQEEVYGYGEKKFGQQGEYAQLQEKLAIPLQEKVRAAIGDVAKEEKVDFVFDKLQGSGLLFANDKYDLTFKVLDRLKRGK